MIAIDKASRLFQFSDKGGFKVEKNFSKNLLLILWCVFLISLSVNAQVVKDWQKISDMPGLSEEDYFGRSVASLEDMDGDGVEDLAVGAPWDDDGGTDRGAVWILFLKANGRIKNKQKISDTKGGFTGVLDDNDWFGRSVAGLGDVDGDGVEDLAVGASADDDGGSGKGAMWILFMNADGTVKSHQKISDIQGGFGGVLDNHDELGNSVANMGDIDGDGVVDLAVGAYGDDDGGHNHGAVWILFLNADGTVKSHQKISDTQGGFTGVLDDGDFFGRSLANMGDIDGDGVEDLAVGAHGDDDGGYNHGAVWILFLNADGTVKSHQKISDTEGGFTGVLDVWDFFGTSVANIGDIDSDEVVDLAVGAKDDDGGDMVSDRGAVWILFLNADGTVKSHQKISDTEGGFGGVLDDDDYFGSSVARLEDVNGDGVVDLVVGADEDDDGGTDRGAVWILFMNADGTVKSYQKISSRPGLDDFDYFGSSAAGLGDIDGDGVVDLAVGADGDDDGGGGRGSVWILFLNPDGTFKDHQKISDTEGGFGGVLISGDRFGRSLANMGDIDGDGVVDLAVGAYLDNDGGTDRGAVWILFLNADGTVKSEQKISDTQGGFGGVLDNYDYFGSSVAAIGDIDGDGVEDLAVGADEDDDGGTDRGAVWILFLNVDWTVKSHQKISDTQGGFTGVLDDEHFFGHSLANMGDLDGDGVEDLAVGAYGNDDGGTSTFPNRGAVWILFLNADGTVKSHQKISATQGGFSGGLSVGDRFGRSLANMGDIDGDGVVDLAVGADGDDDGGGGWGSVWILFLNADGTVKGHQKISGTEGGFGGVLSYGDGLGLSAANMGDLDGDGFMDLAAGAYRDDDGGYDRGAVWVLFLCIPEAPEYEVPPSPGDGAVDVPVTGTSFSWLSASGATSYNVYFGRSKPPFFVTNTTGLTYSPSLMPGSMYYWQIESVNECGEAQGSVWSFETECPLPESPEYDSPGDGAVDVSLSAALNWHVALPEVGAAVVHSFNVYLLESEVEPDPGDLPFVDNTPELTYSPALAYGKTYYWKIGSVNYCGETEGPMWSFTVEAHPNPPSAEKLLPEAIWSTAGGEGGEWRSDLVVRNMDSVPTTVNVTYYYYDGAEDVQVGPVPIGGAGSEVTLLPGHSVKVENVVQMINEWAASLPNGDELKETVGALVLATGGPVISASGRTYSFQPHAQTGKFNMEEAKVTQAVSPTPANLVMFGEPVIIQNMSHMNAPGTTDNVRSSVAVFNPTDAAVEVDFAVEDKDGTVISSKPGFLVPAKGFRALTFEHDFGLASVPGYSALSLIVEVTSGAGGVATKGATSNYLTNDPAVHDAVKLGAASSRKLMQEAIWSTAGGEGGQWRSDLVVRNMDSVATTVNVTYYYYNGAFDVQVGPVPIGGVGSEVMLLPGQSVKVENVVRMINEWDASLPNGDELKETVGGLVLATDGPVISVSGRTYSFQPDAQTGQFNMEEAKVTQAASETPEYLVTLGNPWMVQNLSHMNAPGSTDNVRSSVAVFNPTDAAVVVDFVVEDKDGTVKSSKPGFLVPAKGFRGLSFEHDFGLASEPGYSALTLIVEITSGEGWLVFRGATANYLTNDPASHMPVPLR